MPYIQQYIPAPENLDLPVILELPEGYSELLSNGLGYKEATLGGQQFALAEESYHHCIWCKGWIPGHPNKFAVNALRPLSGRKGTDYHCRRCGSRIGFLGIIS